MGFPGIFKHHDQKGCIVADFCLRFVFHLLHTLEPVTPRPGLGKTAISDRRLELACNDGSYYAVVLVEFKVD